MQDYSEKYSNEEFKRRYDRYHARPLDDEGSTDWAYRIDGQEDLEFVFKLVEKHNDHTPKYKLKIKKIVFIDDHLYAKLTSKGGICFTNDLIRKKCKTEHFEKPEDWDQIGHYRWKRGMKKPTFSKLMKREDQWGSNRVEEQEEMEVVGDISEDALLALQRFTGAKGFKKEDGSLYLRDEMKSGYLRKNSPALEGGSASFR